MISGSGRSSGEGNGYPLQYPKGVPHGSDGKESASNVAYAIQDISKTFLYLYYAYLSIKINKFEWTENTTNPKVIFDFAIGNIIHKFKYVKLIMYSLFIKNIFITKCIYNDVSFSLWD